MLYVYKQTTDLYQIYVVYFTQRKFNMHMYVDKKSLSNYLHFRFIVTFNNLRWKVVQAHSSCQCVPHCG